ncbi:hypothetical protein BDD12DRAFT_810139 [Trichophaea hybrida]|nr:hypothetical protein BDD12DRAFT_810139 [Trichophaea hybrida]
MKANKMAPYPFLLLLLVAVVGIVNAQDTLLPRHRHEKRQEQQQIAACERELRRHNGESFCYDYLSYPRTATVSTTTTTTKYGRPVIRTERTAVVETYTVTRTKTKDVSLTTTTTTTTLTNPPTESTITIKRRADSSFPSYLRQFTSRHIRAACLNIITPSPPTSTVTRTRTRTVLSHPTVLITKTYTHRTKAITTTTIYLSTSTVTDIITTTVPHPCDDSQANKVYQVMGVSIDRQNPSLELVGGGLTETQCCGACWYAMQCNGWLYDNGQCWRQLAFKGGIANDMCPNGVASWIAFVDMNDSKVTGQGPCGFLGKQKR